MTVPRPHIPNVTVAPNSRDFTLRRTVDQINANFQRLTRSLYNVDSDTDSQVADLVRRVRNLEGRVGSVSTTVNTITSPGTVPVTEITPNTVTVALAGASVTATAVVPAESLLFGIEIVITGMTGAASLDAGVTGNVDQFGAALTTSGWISNFTFFGPHYVFGSALNVLLTANGGAFTGGSADVTGYYWRHP